MKAKLILFSALYISAIIGFFVGIGLFIAGIVKSNTTDDGTEASKQKRRKGLTMLIVGGLLFFVSFVIIRESSDPKSAKRYGIEYSV